MVNLCTLHTQRAVLRLTAYGTPLPEKRVAAGAVKGRHELLQNLPAAALLRRSSECPGAGVLVPLLLTRRSDWASPQRSHGRPYHWNTSNGFHWASESSAVSKTTGRTLQANRGQLNRRQDA